MPSKKETKRDIIIEAAYGLFLEKGYSSTKIVDIASAAGIGKGTVYEYFNSKEDLLLEILNTKVAEEYLLVEESLKATASGRTRLRGYLEFQKMCIQRYRLNIFDLRQELLRLDENTSIEIMRALHKVVMSQFTTIHRIIADGVAKGEFRNVNPSLAANCIIGIINSYVPIKYAAILTPDEEATMQKDLLTSVDSWTDDQLLSLILDGLAFSPCNVTAS